MADDPSEAIEAAWSREADCVDLDKENCIQLTNAGACAAQPTEMVRSCAKSCGVCSAQTVCKRPGECLPHMSRYEEKALSKQTARACSAVARIMRGEHRCEGLEDEASLKDRGYFVVRNFTPAAELAAMTAFVHEVEPKGRRMLCGASDVQPDECRVSGQGLQRLFPTTHAKVRSLFDRWIDSGFNHAAELGWPLEISGSEFISINSWEFAQNASCVLTALYQAAEEHLDAACLGKCDLASRNDSTSYCWTTCRYDAILNRMPTARILEVLGNAKSSASCPPTLYSALDGPVEYLMGGDSFWDFGDPKLSPRGWGSRRLLSNLKAWLTQMSNTSMYQGWHDWHTDGPSHYGRYHKVFIMVAKADAPGATQRSNVKLVPADALDAHMHCWKVFADDEEFSDDFMFNQSWPRKSEGARAGRARVRPKLLSRRKSKTMDESVVGAKIRKRRLWGVNDQWLGFERLGCDIPMDPGDMLFFREDVWHRTQDMDLDRIGLILDILRFPLTSMPVASRFPPLVRLPQQAVLSRLIRLPALSEALAAYERGAHCAALEDASQLPERGFVVLRQVVSVENRQALLASLAQTGIAKVEAGGRVYSRNFGRGELGRMSPGLIPELQAKLDALHALNLLPPARAPSTIDGSSAIQVNSGAFIRVDTSYLKDKSAPSPDWHVDGDGYRQSRQHKLWLMIDKQEGKEARSHSNIVVTPSTGLEALADAALAIDAEPTLLPKHTNHRTLGEDPVAWALLETVGCTLVLDPGDALFMTEDVFHRTQDLLANRVAMLLEVF